MIIILKHEYKSGTDPLLDLISEVDHFLSIDELVNKSDITRSTLGRRLLSLEKSGKLVRYRQKNNHFIWMIGNDARERYNTYEALQIAVHRLGYAVDEDDTKEVLTTLVFERNEYFYKINRLLKAKSYPETQELYDYIDALWERYNDSRTDKKT